MLGVVLLLYNLLLKECQNIDDEDGNLQRQEEGKAALNQEWELASSELKKVEEHLREQGAQIVGMINRKERCTAVINNDKAKNIRLAAGSIASRKKKSKKGGSAEVIQQCHSTHCFITAKDINIE